MAMVAPQQMSKPFDLMAFDAEGTPVLAVEVTSAPKRAVARRWLQEHATAMGIPYALVVDPESTQLFDLSEASAAPILVLPTRELLAQYAHDLDAKKATERYLILLVDTWLRNVMQPLAASPPPPAFDELRKTGIVTRLGEGQTVAEWRGFF